MWTQSQRAQALSVACVLLDPDAANALIFKLEARYPEVREIPALVNRAAWRICIDDKRKAETQRRLRLRVAARYKLVAEELALKATLLADLRQALSQVEARGTGRAVLGARICVVVASGEMTWAQVFAQYPDTATNTVYQWGARGGKRLLEYCGPTTCAFIQEGRKVRPARVAYLGIPEKADRTDDVYLTRYQKMQGEAYQRAAQKRWK